MKKIVAGFSLLEFIIYCSLLFLLCYVLFSWWIEVGRQTKNIMQSSERNAHLYAVRAIIARDIERAFTHASSWQIEGNAISFAHEEGVITLLIKKDRLYRQFQPTSSAKIGKHKSVIATGIKGIAWNLMTDQGCVNKVTCKIIASPTPDLVWSFFPRNGKIV